MRPMTETRKRRLSDPQLLANKRLSNGFSKTDHVTTRSQAKSDARVSPPRKVKHKTLTTEERRLTISMRLRHEEKHTTQASLNTPQANQDGRRKSTTRILPVNGRKNGISSPVKLSRTRLRTKVLTSVNAHQNDISERVMHETLKRAKEVKNREIRAKKRRSALWVLNCEAEEFLFGETAADGQEVELPPISSPPKKRQRMRATELGELLRETPLLESKLRQSTFVGNSESETSEILEVSSNQNRTQKRGRTKTSLYRVSDPESGLSEGEDDSSNLEFPNLNYTLLLEAASVSRSSSSSLTSAPSEQSVRIKRILNSIEYSFSFENVPSSEVWYRTFSHQNRPRNTFHMTATTESRVVLPYEAKGLKGELEKRLRRPPRKSPRCHASTQAILSALKPTRSGRLVMPPSPHSPQPSTSSKSKPINITTHIEEAPVPSSSLSSSLGSQSHVSSSIQPLSLLPSVIAPNAIQIGIKSCEMTATQYLWDSIQFLSDPYVIHVLSLADRRSKGSSSSFQYSNNLKKESSLVSSSPGKRCLKNTYVNHNNNLKTPLKVFIPSSSPKFIMALSSTTELSPSTKSPSPTTLQNGYCSRPELRRVLRSPPTTALTTVSPPLRQSLTPSPPGGGSNVRKSPRKCSGLVVSADSTMHLNKHSPYSNFGSKFKSTSPKLPPFSILPPPKEEMLFSAEMTLPDFPWDSFL